MSQIRPFAVALLALVACGGGADAAEGGDAPAAAMSAGTPMAETPVDFGEAELDWVEKGFALETDLAKAAETKAANAATPADRGAAAQEGWETATIPAAAKTLGADERRYREVRGAVDYALETLDFQGKIDGPKEMDTTLATPEMKGRLTADPYAHLTPAAAAALRGRLDRITAVWVKYVNQTVASY